MGLFSFFGKKKKEEKLFEQKREKKFGSDVETLKASKLASLVLSKTEELAKRGPRKAGTQVTREVARELHSNLSDYTDEAVITSFRATESSYYGSFKIIAYSVIPILILCWLGLSYAAIFIYAAVCFLSYKEFFLCKNALTPLFRKSSMSNVHGIINPKDNVEKTVIVSAHHDSAPMFTAGDNSNDLLISLYLPLVHYIFLGLVIIALFITDIIGGKFFVINLAPLALLIILSILTLSLPLYWKLIHLVSKHYSPGVGDNLVSSVMLTELAHFFNWEKKQGKGFKHTRIIFASFDAEECGLKGSSTWYEKHKDLLSDDCINLNIDSPYYSEHLAFLTKDVNGLVPLSSSLAAECAEKAKRMGFSVKVGGLSLFSGATDAASAARAGVDSTTLVGIPLGGKAGAPYHTENDTIDSLNAKTIEEVISIIIKIVKTSEPEIVSEEDKTSLEDNNKKFRLTKN